MKIIARKTNAGSSQRVRPPGGAGFRSFRSSGTRLASGIMPRSKQENGSRKRVRLADNREENCLGFREDEATAQEEAGVRISDVPKTSEYAFFKKLKENKGHRFSSHSMQKDATPAKEVITGHNPNTSINVVDSNYKKSGSSLLHQHVTHKNSASIQAPFGTWYTYKSGEIFPKKRENLFLWVKTTSFPEIDELCSKGYGFVSILLSRLNPMINEDNDSTIMSSKLHAYPHSGIQLKEFKQNCSWDFLEAEGGQYLDCSPSSGWLNSSMGRIFPGFVLPAVASHKTITWQESEDEFQAPDKSLTEEKTHDSEWGWALDNRNNKRDLCLVHRSRELTTAPVLPTYRCNNDCQQILESGFGGRELSAFSVSSHYPSKFCPLLCHPTSFHNNDLESHYDPQTLQAGFVGSELSSLFVSGHHPSEYWPSQCQWTSFRNNDLETYYDQQTLSGFGGRELPAFSVSSHYPLQFCPSQFPSISFHNHEYETENNSKQDIGIFSDLPCSLSRDSYNSHGAEYPNFDDSCAVLLPPEQDQFIHKGFSERRYHPLSSGFIHSLDCDSDLSWMCLSSPVSSEGEHIFSDYTYQSPQNGAVLLSFLHGVDWYKRLNNSTQLDAFSRLSRSFLTQIFDGDTAYALLTDNSNSDEGEVIVHESKICKFDASWHF